MDFAESEDHIAIVEAVDHVCAKFDDTYWSQCDQDHEFPWTFYAAMAEGGWLGIAIPEEFGGGGHGRGFQHLLHGINPERILLAAMACGIGEAALRRAVR